MYRGCVDHVVLLRRWYDDERAKWTRSSQEGIGAVLKVHTQKSVLYNPPDARIACGKRRRGISTCCGEEAYAYSARGGK